MNTVSVRRLANHTSEVIAELTESGKPVVLTNRGIPVAVMVPLSIEQMEQWALAHFGELMEGRKTDGSESPD